MNLDIQIINVWFSETKVFFDYADGRTVGAPLECFPRLKNATDSQKKRWRLIAGGYGVHWEEIDEDLSAERMLYFKK